LFTNIGMSASTSSSTFTGDSKREVKLQAAVDDDVIYYMSKTTDKLRKNCLLLNTSTDGKEICATINEIREVYHGSFCDSEVDVALETGLIHRVTSLARGFFEIDLLRSPSSQMNMDALQDLMSILSDISVDSRAAAVAIAAGAPGVALGMLQLKKYTKIVIKSLWFLANIADVGDIYNREIIAIIMASFKEILKDSKDSSERSHKYTIAYCLGQLCKIKSDHLFANISDIASILTDLALEADIETHHFALYGMASLKKDVDFFGTSRKLMDRILEISRIQMDVLTAKQTDTLLKLISHYTSTFTTDWLTRNEDFHNFIIDSSMKKHRRIGFILSNMALESDENRQWIFKNDLLPSVEYLENLEFQKSVMNDQLYLLCNYIEPESGKYVFRHEFVTGDYHKSIIWLLKKNEENKFADDKAVESANLILKMIVDNASKEQIFRLFA
jgi:hypothetical protein